MAVKVNHGHGAVCAVDGTEQRQGDGVVSAEGDDARKSLALDRGAPLVRVRDGGAGEDVEVSLLNLTEGKGVVISWQVSGNPPLLMRLGQTYEVTGISPQSRTVAQLLNGLVFRGTLYPPLRVVVSRAFARRRRCPVLTRDSVCGILGGCQKVRT